MGNPSAAQEPSMEEILASIRQIISEDGEQPEGEPESSADEGGSPMAEAEGAEPEMPAGELGHEPAGEAASDAVEADDGEPAAMAAAAPARPAEASEPMLRRQPAPSQPSEPARPADSAAQPPRPAAGAGGLPASAAATYPDRRLLSPQADASVSGAFSALAHTILAQNARTLEDLVSEMLRPMLKEWLDDNLPPLVERLVKEEIERVSRGRH